LRGRIVRCGKEVGVGAEAIEVFAGRADDYQRPRCVAELANVILLQVTEPNLANAAPLSPNTSNMAVSTELLVGVPAATAPKFTLRTPFFGLLGVKIAQNRSQTAKTR
jgi:hypothetical protein